jgi:ubiquinone/menaquinone biosynthesis C-methylase UbiE
MRRAHALGISNIVPRQGDAQALPHPDGRFDVAYLVATLGEVPDKERALRELGRVLKPGGRLVVGESQPDLHMVSFDKLRMLADVAGLSYERRVGGTLGYLASFRASNEALFR